MSSTAKTSIIIGILTLIAIVSFFRDYSNLAVSLPLFIFYMLFMFNSFFSIKLFFGIIPPTLKTQMVIDGILAVIYIVMALNFNNALLFSYLIALFFIFGSAKYVFLLPILKNQPKLLKNKIMVNQMGCAMGIVAIGATLLGYVSFAVWFIAIAFAIANIFIFILTPLYKLDTEA